MQNSSKLHNWEAFEHLGYRDLHYSRQMISLSLNIWPALKHCYCSIIGLFGDQSIVPPLHKQKRLPQSLLLQHAYVGMLLKAVP